MSKPERPRIPHKYTCSLLKRADALLARLRGKEVYWHPVDGSLNEAIRREDGTFSHGVELRGVFPDWAYRAACHAQNRWSWTRGFLDWRPRQGALVEKLLQDRDELVEALVWCGGSGDFAPEGKARVGWERGPAWLISRYARGTPMFRQEEQRP